MLRAKRQRLRTKRQERIRELRFDALLFPPYALLLALSRGSNRTEIDKAADETTGRAAVCGKKAK